MLLTTLGHNWRLLLVTAIGTGLREADATCSDLVIRADVLVLDLYGHVVLVDDVELEDLVPNGVLAPIGVGLALVPLTAAGEDAVRILWEQDYAQTQKSTFNYWD